MFQDLEEGEEQTLFVSRKKPDCRFVVGEDLRWFQKGASGGPPGRRPHPKPRGKLRSRPSVSGFPGDRRKATAASPPVDWPLGL